MLKEVYEFANAFGHKTNVGAQATGSELNLRHKLNTEEVHELNAAFAALHYNVITGKGVTVDALKELLKEAADVVYVVAGMCAYLGLDLDGAYKEVHRSNMSKLGSDGKPIYREDGKVLKGPNYSEANMEPFL